MGSRRSSFTQVEVETTVVQTPIVEEQQWSQQQQDIFDWFASESIHPDDGFNPNLVVRARAGTGKTTTIIEGVNRAPESSILVCAFNKRIADVLNSRITNPAAEAKTLHAVGYAAIRQQWPGISVAQGSTRGDYLTDTVCAKDTPKPIRRLITLLHTKGREMVPLTPSTAELLKLALFFDYVPAEGWGQYTLEFVVEKAMYAIAGAARMEPTQDIGIDFADMIYLPLAWKLLSKDYELVVVDEAQDLSVAQLEIAQSLCSGRICLVGDNFQSIYQFRGADSNSLDRLKTELGAAELPLTTTYRCAQSIVRRAQVLVPDIQASPDSPEGIIDTCDYEGLLEGASEGNFILSRLNAPLVSITLQLLKRKKRAKMAGRDVGAGIQAVIKRLQIGSYSCSLGDLLSRLTKWEQKTTTRFAAYGQLDLVDRCRDQAEMVRAVAEDSDDLADLLNRIDWLFTDDEDAEQILCSSIHKAKGLEADRVYILQESLYRRGPSQEEDNCSYVATTRARRHLTLVSGVPGL